MLKAFISIVKSCRQAVASLCDSKSLIEIPGGVLCSTTGPKRQSHSGAQYNYIGTALLEKLSLSQRVKSERRVSAKTLRSLCGIDFIVS